MKCIGSVTDIEFKRALCEEIKKRNGTREEFMSKCPHDEYNDSKINYLEYYNMTWGISKWGFKPIFAPQTTKS